MDSANSTNDSSSIATEPVGTPMGTPPGRRNFLTAFFAFAIGGIVSIVPLVPGLLVFLNPLRRNKGESGGGGEEPGRWVKVTTLDALPADGKPRRFTLRADRQDAWTFYENEPVGSVYLRRMDGSDELLAITTVCPHLGCAVSLKTEGDGEDKEFAYACPCHTSEFTVTGEKVAGPSPRPLDTLQAEIRNGSEVWVKYQKFAAGHPEKHVEA